MSDSHVKASHVKATVKYNRSRDQIMIKPDKATGAAIRSAAAAAGQPLQRYILDACMQRMRRDAASAADDHSAL